MANGHPAVPQRSRRGDFPLAVVAIVALVAGLLWWQDQAPPDPTVVARPALDRPSGLGPEQGVLLHRPEPGTALEFTRVPQHGSNLDLTLTEGEAPGLEQTLPLLDRFQIVEFEDWDVPDGMRLLERSVGVHAAGEAYRTVIDTSAGPQALQISCLGPGQVLLEVLRGERAPYLEVLTCDSRRVTRIFRSEPPGSVAVLRAHTDAGLLIHMQVAVTAPG